MMYNRLCQIKRRLLPVVFSVALGALMAKSVFAASQDVVAPIKAPMVDVSNITRSLELNEHLLVYRDERSEQSILKIIRPGQQSLFQYPDDDMNYGFSDATYWVKLSLSNSSDRARRVILRQNYPLIDHLGFWQVDKGRIVKEVITGDRKNFDTRDIKHKEFLFEVEVPSQTSHTIYFQFKTEGSMNIGLSANDSTFLLEQFASNHLALGIYYGGFMVLAFYNMFLFFAARLRAFVHYLWYLISYGVYMSVHNGIAFQYLWPESPSLANQSLLILLGSTLYWGTKFSQTILAIEQLSPKTDRLGIWLQRIVLVLTALCFFMPYALMIQVMSLFTVVICVYIMIIGIMSLIARYKPAYYFILAWSLLLVAVLIYMLKTFGLLPHNSFTQNAFQIASLLEMMLLSVALAYHFNEIKRKSYTDALTFLYNRRHFDDVIETEFEKSRASQKPLSLLVLDIDHFKKFNDSYGHAEGDKVLKQVAEILKDSVRKPALACRYGGEEFVVILPRTQSKEAYTLADRIRSLVESSTFSEHKVTISIGVATVSETGQSTLEFSNAAELFKAADNALYSAKANGRNRVEQYLSANESEHSGESVGAPEHYQR